MYHINNNKRCINSCTLIYKALIKLIRGGQNNIENITILDLSRASTISRATFYRHFDTIIDVLVWESDREMEIAFEKLVPVKDTKQFIGILFEHWHKNSLLLDVLVAIGRAEIILNSLEKVIEKYSYLILEGTRLDYNRRQYIMSIWSVILWAVLRKWISDGKKTSVEELTNIALHNMPLPSKRWQ